MAGNLPTAETWAEWAQRNSERLPDGSYRIRAGADSPPPSKPNVYERLRAQGYSKEAAASFALARAHHRTVPQRNLDEATARGRARAADLENTWRYADKVLPSGVYARPELGLMTGLNRLWEAIRFPGIPDDRPADDDRANAYAWAPGKGVDCCPICEHPHHRQTGPFCEPCRKLSHRIDTLLKELQPTDGH
jgi:hypothetical protein